MKRLIDIKRTLHEAQLHEAPEPWLVPFIQRANKISMQLEDLYNDLERKHSIQAPQYRKFVGSLVKLTNQFEDIIDEMVELGYSK